MKRFAFPLLFLTLTPFSCSREPQLSGYHDVKYPIALKYAPKKMEVLNYFANAGDYFVTLKTDLSNEFKRSYPDIYTHLYSIGVYNKEFFREFWSVGPETKEDETTFNGTPAIVSKNNKGQPNGYILIIPGLYAEIRLEGIDVNSMDPGGMGVSQEYSDRMEQLTYEMIKHFKWEQKIDTSSEEFKAWKKHIWEILNGVRP